MQLRGPLADAFLQLRSLKLDLGAQTRLLNRNGQMRGELLRRFHVIGGEGACDVGRQVEHTREGALHQQRHAHLGAQAFRAQRLHPLERRLGVHVGHQMRPAGTWTPTTSDVGISD